MPKCAHCGEEVERDAKVCLRCSRRVDIGEEVYELPDHAGEIPVEWQADSLNAIYAIEQPARCPFCREIIRTVRVLRLKRSHVPFTSTLPRGGRMILCSACDSILSADL
jgi:hypothetical protein